MKRIKIMSENVSELFEKRFVKINGKWEEVMVQIKPGASAIEAFKRKPYYKAANWKEIINEYRIWNQTNITRLYRCQSKWRVSATRTYFDHERMQEVIIYDWTELSSSQCISTRELSQIIDGRRIFETETEKATIL